MKLIYYYRFTKEEVIDKAIDYLSRAIRGLNNRKEIKRTGKYILTREAVNADTAYRQVLSAVEKDDVELENFLSEHIEMLKKTKTGHDIESQKIDNLIQFFRVIISKIRPEQRYNNYLGVQACPA